MANYILLKDFDGPNVDQNGEYVLSSLNPPVWSTVSFKALRNTGLSHFFYDSVDRSVHMYGTPSRINGSLTYISANFSIRVESRDGSRLFGVEDPVSVSNVFSEIRLRFFVASDEELPWRPIVMSRSFSPRYIYDSSQPDNKQSLYVMANEADEHGPSLYNVNMSSMIMIPTFPVGDVASVPTRIRLQAYLNWPLVNVPHVSEARVYFLKGASMNIISLTKGY